jgi:hypothetical protein
LGLTGLDLLAVTVIAALPTAQSVFNFAVRTTARGSWPGTRFLSPLLLSVPAILIITWLLA